MRRFIITGLSLSVLVGCTAAHEGPPIELVDVAVPKVVSDALMAPKPELVPPPPPPPVPRSSFKAWIPRVVLPNGDIYGGQHVEVSDKAPQKELIKPDYEIPKAPKHISRPQGDKKATAGQSAAPGPASAPPPPPPYGGMPFMPPGFSGPQEGPYGFPQP